MAVTVIVIINYFYYIANIDLNIAIFELFHCWFAYIGASVTFTGLPPFLCNQGVVQFDPPSLKKEFPGST